MHPSVEAGLTILGIVRDDVQVHAQSALQAVAGTGKVHDSRVGLTVEFHLFNQTPYSEPRTKAPLMAAIHETATRNATGRSLNRRHIQPDLPPQNRASWNDMIELDGTLLAYTDRVAWHAGKAMVPRGRWAGQGSTFIRQVMWGIELLGPNDGTPVTERQKDTLARRLWQLELNHGIIFDRQNSLFEHNEIDIPDGRKSDSRGCNADEIERRLIDLRRGSVPTPERPPVGEYFINVAVALLRANPNRRGRILARLPRGTRVFINKWVDGEIVDGNKNWGETHPDPRKEEFLHGSTVKRVPPQTARRAITEFSSTQLGKAEVFLANKMPVLTANAIELVECGGFAED